MPDTPLVSIAIPLYKSLAFVRVILTNIRRIRIPSVEILISDRHLEDEAIFVLERVLAGDPRVRFLKASDRIGWVDHYNALLMAASGTYFMWMTHDDSYPARYVADLVEDLRAHEDAWLSFGRMYRVDKQLKSKDEVTLPLRLNRNARNWNALDGVKFTFQYNPAIAIRGMFRRDWVVQNGLFIRHCIPGDQLADQYWMFAIGIHGRIFYNADQLCVKRFYNSSTHRSWDSGNFFSKDAYRTVMDYIRAAPLSPTERALVTVAIRGFLLKRSIIRALPEHVVRLGVRFFGKSRRRRVIKSLGVGLVFN